MAFVEILLLPDLVRSRWRRPVNCAILPRDWTEPDSSDGGQEAAGGQARVQAGGQREKIKQFYLLYL